MANISESQKWYRVRSDLLSWCSPRNKPIKDSPSRGLDSFVSSSSRFSDTISRTVGNTSSRLVASFISLLGLTIRGHWYWLMMKTNFALIMEEEPLLFPAPSCPPREPRSPCRLWTRRCSRPGPRSGARHRRGQRWSTPGCCPRPPPPGWRSGSAPHQHQAAAKQMTFSCF